MIGIIYKLTIRAKVKFDGHKPFYVGQHRCKSAEDFLCRDYPYCGSGKIWNILLSKLKKTNLRNWRNFIKREVLCVVTNGSQETLDKLEEFWIKREKAHYSYGLGGCNVLWGAAENIIHVDDIVIEKIKAKWQDPAFKEKMRKLHIGLQAGKKHPLYGRKHSVESIEKMSKSHRLYYKKKGHFHLSEEHKRRISESHIGSKNPMYGKHLTKAQRNKVSKALKNCIVVTNGKDVKYVLVGQEIPEGYVRGRVVRIPGDIHPKNPNLVWSICSNGKTYGWHVLNKKKYEITDELRKRLSEARKGKKASPEFKKIMSERFSGANNPAYGKIWINNGEKIK